jgi:hypothetical protein
MAWPSQQVKARRHLVVIRLSDTEMANLRRIAARDAPNPTNWASRFLSSALKRESRVLSRDRGPASATPKRIPKPR